MRLPPSVTAVFHACQPLDAVDRLSRYDVERVVGEWRCGECGQMWRITTRVSSSEARRIGQASRRWQKRTAALLRADASTGRPPSSDENRTPAEG